jgi:hypothetical protein
MRGSVDGKYQRAHDDELVLEHPIESLVRSKQRPSKLNEPSFTVMEPSFKVVEL